MCFTNRNPKAKQANNCQTNFVLYLYIIFLQQKSHKSSFLIKIVLNSHFTRQIPNTTFLIGYDRTSKFQLDSLIEQQAPKIRSDQQHVTIQLHTETHGVLLCRGWVSEPPTGPILLRITPLLLFLSPVAGSRESEGDRTVLLLLTTP